METCKNESPDITAALETSGRNGSVAISIDGLLSDEHKFSAPMRHSAELFSAIIEILSKKNYMPNQIKQVFISAGPGSFTGVRISVAAAKMYALVNNAEIVAVNTSDVIAQNVDSPDINRIATIIDAKRGLFFVAVFEKTPAGTWQKTLPDCMLTAEQFKDRFAKAETIHLLGEGLLYYKDKFTADGIEILDEKFWSPTAANVFKLGKQLAAKHRFSNPVSLVPFYIRRTDAEENWEKKNEHTQQTRKNH